MSTLFDQLRHAETITGRRHAALALGTSHEEGVVDVLVERLRDEPDGHVREDITWALVQHAREAEGQLLALLTSDVPHDRFSGAHVLSKIGNPAHFDAVAPLVLDEHADVALKAYRAAANTGGLRAAEVLARRLGDGDEWQRDALSDAFRKLGEGAVPVLVAALDSESSDVRDHAVEALGYLGEHAASAADAVEARVADEYEPVRLTAVSTLGQLGEAARPALERVAASEDPVLSALAKRHLERLG